MSFVAFMDRPVLLIHLPFNTPSSFNSVSFYVLMIRTLAQGQLSRPNCLHLRQLYRLTHPAKPELDPGWAAFILNCSTGTLHIYFIQNFIYFHIFCYIVFVYNNIKYQHLYNLLYKKSSKKLYFLNASSVKNSIKLHSIFVLIEEPFIHSKIYCKSLQAVLHLSLYL